MIANVRVWHGTYIGLDIICMSSGVAYGVAESACKLTLNCVFHKRK